jgi:hypothetical protein
MLKKEAVYGVQYSLPAIPHNREIDNYTKQKRDQKFERVDFEPVFKSLDFDEDGNPLFTDAMIKFIYRELDRIDDGYFFYNNGTLTYITGHHYMYLNYWTLEDGEQPDYRDCDRKWWYFKDYCEKQSYVDGIIRSKKRREGATSQECCDLVRTAIRKKKAFCGVVSKTGDDAKSAFIDMIKNGYENLPIFLVPLDVEDPDSQTSIVFRKPKNRNTKKTKANRRKGQVFEDEKGMGSRINYKPTKLNSYDSGRLTEIMIDECFAPGTRILMSDMSFKNIEDIVVGDFVMVEGGKHRMVGRTVEGFDDMYRIRQPYSKDYVVNSKHRLYLEQRASVRSIHDDGIKKITPLDFLNLGKYRTRTTFGLKSEGIEYVEQPVPLDPYFFGIWLGDGDKADGRIVVNHIKDPEIYHFLENYASSTNAVVKKYSPQGCQCVDMVRIIDNDRVHGKRGRVTGALHRLSVLGNKHIPDQYIQNSIENRRKLLAGIIDTDGYSKGVGRGFEICMANKNIVDQIQFVARSCGYDVSKVAEKVTNYKNKLAYRITISGDVSTIPTKVKRKQQEQYKRKYKSRKCRIEVEPEGYGKYHGITLISENDDDRRLILEDFTISMNCGKFPTDVPVNEYWPIVRKTLKQGGRRVGFALLPSTSNKLTKGGRGFKVLWDESNHNDSPVTGSGLYRYFCPADDGFPPFIDEYGVSIRSKPTKEQVKWMKDKYGADDIQCSMSAKEYILYLRSLIRDPSTLNEEIRMNPLSESEAFDFDDNSNIYNMIAIRDQKERIAEVRPKIRRIRFTRDGEGKSTWVDDQDGMWWVLDGGFPDEAERNQVVKNAMLGSIKPANTAKYVHTADPYKNTLITGPGSKGAGFIWKKFNPLDKENTGMPVAMFWGRPRRKRVFHEQQLLAAEFWGCEMCYESDYDEYIEFLEGEGKMHYAMKRPKNTIDPNKKKAAAKKKEFGIKSGDGFSYTMMVDKSVEYVDFYCGKIWFLSLLEQLEEYDADNRTAYDLAVAFQLGCVAIAEMVQKKSDKFKSQPLVKTYSL